MASLKYTIVWLGFLLVQLDLVHSFSISLNVSMKRCPTRIVGRCRGPFLLEVSKNCCSKDQDCEKLFPGKGLKCCEDCEKSCVSPEVTVAEVTPLRMLQKLNMPTRLVAKCPSSPPSSEYPPGPEQECQNDASCDAKFPGQDLKCCSDGNDFRCMPPVVESVVQGYCPAPSPTKPGECSDHKTYREKCLSDAECEQRHPELKSFVKCCEYKCGERLCRFPTQRKAPPPTPIPPITPFTVPGTCPVYPPAGECPPDPDDKCKNDQQCQTLHPGLGLKCCKNGCEFWCVPPIEPPAPPPRMRKTCSGHLK